MRWIFRVFSYVPLPWLHRLGGWLGWVVWWSNSAMRQRFRSHVALAGLPFAMAKPAIAEAGRFVAELPWLWFQPPSRSILTHVAVEGMAHARQAFAKGNGVVIVGAHCGGFEIASQALAELLGPTHGPLVALYRPARQKTLAQWEKTARTRPYLDIMPASMGSIRRMHRALRNKQAVAMLCDQVPPEGQGVWVPFFGQPAYTVTLAMRLALQTGAAVLPVSCERLPAGKGFRLKFWPVLAEIAAIKSSADNPDADLREAVTRMNKALESIILSQPGQYLWAYARYKQPRKDTPRQEKMP